MTQSELFPLSPEQADAARDELVRLLTQRNRTTVKKKEAADEFNRELKLIEDQVEGLRDLLVQHGQSLPGHKMAAALVEKFPDIGAVE